MFYTLLPKNIRDKLFGERETYGSIPFPDDPDWQEWLHFYYGFYQDTQKSGVSKVVNHSGYRITKQIDFTDKVVLEIGPGDLPHTKYWQQKPSEYIVCDIREEFVAKSKAKLESLGIKSQGYVIRQPKVPLPDNSVDIFIGFYVLEHLAPLDMYLKEILRVLKPGGLLVAGIPTEGGLGWGVGRFFSSRRYIKKHSNMNPDKLICWEHPNFAKTILKTLREQIEQVKIKYWPFYIPAIDFNLIISFIFRKKG